MGFLDELGYLAGGACYNVAWANAVVDKLVQNHARATEFLWCYMGFSDVILSRLLRDGSPLWQKYKDLVKEVDKKRLRYGDPAVRDWLAEENTTQVCSAVRPIYTLEWYIAVDSALTRVRDDIRLSSRFLDVRSTSEGLHPQLELNLQSVGGEPFEI